MPKTQVSCPNCRQPVVADVEQLFDVYADPSAKQRLLSGAFNLVRCQFCGYQGNLATPLVYHDPDKELLLTFVPTEIGLPRNEQERVIGSLINQVLKNLPQEKRKGYLLNPQQTLTIQGLIERVLESDGITREMIQAQQERINLLQRLAGAPSQDVLVEIAKQEDKLIDAEFFSLLRTLVETAGMSGDEQSARRLVEVQRALLPITTFGRQLQEQSKDVEAAVAELRALGQGLTREKLLELVMKADSEVRLRVYVSLVRPAMDYQFFQLLSDHIDHAPEDERQALETLRARLLQMTQEVDQQIQAHAQEVRQAIDAILQSENPVQVMQENMQLVDELFMDELERQLTEARSRGDVVRSGKLQQIVEAIQDASMPEELGLVQQYLDLPDDQARQGFLEGNAEAITDQFLEIVANINAQVQESGDPQVVDHMRAANRQALRFSMQRTMKG